MRGPATEQSLSVSSIMLPMRKKAKGELISRHLVHSIAEGYRYRVASIFSLAVSFLATY